MSAVALASTIPPARVCGCGRQYSEETFDALPFAGIQAVPALWEKREPELLTDEVIAQGPPQLLEPAEIIPMRNCACMSTIARESVVGEVAILDWMIAHWNLLLAHDRERRGIFPDDTELEDVSTLYANREAWDDSDRADFAEEMP